MTDGLLVIDKPKGMTSHDVINELRSITHIKKIGHAGTLDPLATGLLIVGVGKEATKNLQKFQKLAKEYVATIRLGAISETLDSEGNIEEKPVEKIPLRNEIEKLLEGFVGKIKQIPPMFSAKKIQGERAYRLARKGIKVKLQPQQIEIYKIEIVKYDWPYLEIRVHCSSGTYIRALARDIGEKLGCGGIIEKLKRTKIGSFSLKDSVSLLRLHSRNWKKFLVQKMAA